MGFALPRHNSIGVKQMDHNGRLNEADRKVLRRVLNSSALQRLIGLEEWDLREEDEVRLWDIIEYWADRDHGG